MKKWAEAFLKEWYHCQSDSTATSGGDEEDSEDHDSSRLPRGDHQVKIVLWCHITSVEKIMIQQPFNLWHFAVRKSAFESPGTDSNSSDPIVHTDAIVGESGIPAAALGPWEWLDGPGRS